MSKSVKDLLKERYGIMFPIKKLIGNFNCHDHDSLTSLEGCPKIITGECHVARNSLTSLIGSPKFTKSFTCNGNKLTSLEGAPEIVDGSFYCFANQLTSLEGAPKEVEYIFDCSFQKSGKKFRMDEVQDLCNVGGKIRV